MRIKICCISGILLTMFILSCSMINDLNGSNENKRLFEHLYKSNGNAFYIKSTNISISFVWSYSEKKIFIYKLSKGKIIDSRESPNTNSNWLNQFSKKELTEVDSCLELDGDVLGFKLKYDELLVQDDLPVNLDCFVKKKLNSVFLNSLITDINNYQIKW